jgi:glc operon protein GlcG
MSRPDRSTAEPVGASMRLRLAGALAVMVVAAISAGGRPAGAGAASAAGPGAAARGPAGPAAAARVTHIAAADVAAAFAKGVPLLEVPGYKVHASRRESAGMAEVHRTDTDIIHVLEGTAVLVTGGDVVDGKTTAPDEIRGAAIRGGETMRLTAGDVVVVPNGVPHWFREVPGVLLYYVVKVPASGTEGR